jgi:hypothetical protein
MKKLFSLAFLATLILHVAGVSAQTPDGWGLRGMDPRSYESGIDKKIHHSGTSSAFLRSKGKPKAFGTLMQQVSANAHLGKRVRFSGFVKSKNVSIWSVLWFRVDSGRKSVAFDNMGNRPIRGTKNWAKYEIVLDVPSYATGLAYGILLNGKGEVWLDDAKLEDVSNDVPITDLKHAADEPTNLNFEK